MHQVLEFSSAIFLQFRLFVSHGSVFSFLEVQFIIICLQDDGQFQGMYDLWQAVNGVTSTRGNNM
jgi:hypothetical protein